jgi:hypothetical protein
LLDADDDEEEEEDASPGEPGDLRGIYRGAAESTCIIVEKKVGSECG